MTETKYTPEPWMVHHDHGWLVVESACGELYIKVEKGSCATKHIADARLIAAAPELLESAKELASNVQEMCRVFGIPESTTSLKRYDAAIAKATGATQ